MTEYATVEDLTFVDELQVEDVTLQSGKIVQVKGLTRFEYLLCAKNMEGDPSVFEARMLRYGLVQPKISIEQATAWQKAATVKGLNPVSEAIRRLSGMADDAEKSDVS